MVIVKTNCRCLQLIPDRKLIGTDFDLINYSFAFRKIKNIKFLKRVFGYYSMQV